MYDKLNQYLETKGLKLKADESKQKKENIIKEYKDKEKSKKLTTDERLERLEKLMGIVE